jgi:small subunit ribosomal protein S19
MKKFTFKGKGEEELKSLTVEDFARLIPARERRSLKRGYTEQQKKFLSLIRENPKKFHKTHCRELIITPELIGVKIGVHNGKEFQAVQITAEMLGKRLGQFAPTRKPVKHSAPGFGATKSSKFIPLK